MCFCVGGFGVCVCMCLCGPRSSVKRTYGCYAFVRDREGPPTERVERLGSRYDEHHHAYDASFVLIKRF